MSWLQQNMKWAILSHSTCRCIYLWFLANIDLTASSIVRRWLIFLRGDTSPGIGRYFRPAFAAGFLIAGASSISCWTNPVHQQKSPWTTEKPTFNWRIHKFFPWATPTRFSVKYKVQPQFPTGSWKAIGLHQQVSYSVSSVNVSGKTKLPSGNLT